MLGDRLVGVVLNAVTPDEVDSLERQVVPALEGLGLVVFGDTPFALAAQRHGGTGRRLRPA